MGCHQNFAKLFLFLITIYCAKVYPQNTDKRPNILVIMLDDAGLDMSAYGSTYVNTPAFDEIAKQGMLLIRPIRQMPSVHRQERLL